MGCFTQLICREAQPASGMSNKYQAALTLLDLDPTSVIVCQNDTADIDKAMP